MDQNLSRDAVTLTKTLCTHLAAAQFGDLPERARHAARRGVLDWIGCALAASRHPEIDILLAVLAETGGRPQATVLGRRLRLGLLDAPLANGQMGHLLDFDAAKWVGWCCTPRHRCSRRCWRSPRARRSPAPS